MRRRFLCVSVVAAVSALTLTGCGAPGLGPTPPPGGGNGGGGGNPPPNNLPVIDSITVQGTRAKEPANFADVGESVVVSATVTDSETALDQLQYVWTATAGTFSGSGPSVTWQAPAQLPAGAVGAAAVDVTITLTVTEKFGNPGGPLSFEHSAAKTASVSLHDSINEVGTMARQFLLDFSDTNLKDADYIMRNFNAAACPDPRDVQAEREDVIRNYTFFQMLNYRVDEARVTINFASSCSSIHGPRRGDACAQVGVFWDSIDRRDNTRTPNTGTDQIAAAYSVKDARWWLCASDYDGRNLLTGARISR